MAETTLVQARYDDFEAFKQALKALKGARVRRYEAYGPTNLVDLEGLMPEEGSWVRGWSTSGAIIGLATFWIMCVTTALIYSLISGGKPPVSNVPFVIPAYEGTILIGGVFALIAGLFYARLGPRFPPRGYSKRFTEDSYGILVECPENDRARILELLRSTGAAEIHESPDISFE